ncbi:DUF2971 domain-containing protein [Pseudomonas congelans]|uniref:DUF2971 domain-containing protein n=1 Tax=Pseudomonas congelans TaxID=200452 RepID=UPI001BDCEE40|nr:DUF2971 domain-containing protein [Pseudomonas congelans]QVX12746.1 DUF2971 domain-containing protein [Pseudomonas congelans]
MHVFRYRASNLLSQKGLLYDEWYFASKEELNDPVDMQSDFHFSAGGWFKLLDSLWTDKNHVAVAAKYFSQLSPISYEKLVIDFEKIRQDILEEAFKSERVSLGEVKLLHDSLSKLLDLLDMYGPGSGYSVSFSRTSTSMLMWSHYAYSHTGFCLVYRPVNGRLSQCPTRKKDELLVSQNHSSCVPSEFKVEDIIYDNQIKPLDAYTLLPIVHTDSRFDSGDAQKQWHKEKNAQLLTKNICWAYEEECRLMLNQPGKWISGSCTYDNLQRLFYYDFDQIVGVIFGARMSPTDKETLKKIISHKLKIKYVSLGTQR